MKRDFLATVQRLYRLLEQPSRIAFSRSARCFCANGACSRRWTNPMRGRGGGGGHEFRAKDAELCFGQQETGYCTKSWETDMARREARYRLGCRGNKTYRRCCLTLSLVQHRLDRITRNARNYSEPTRARLRSRREHLANPNLLLKYKLIFNLVHLNVDNFFVIGTNNVTRGHQYTLVKFGRDDFFACRLASGTIE